ncbi:MAG TPA: hypothetical protein VF223_13030 [Trebonia sp.]
MANVAKHKFTSPKADGADNTLVQPSDWNAEHVFTGGADRHFLQRQTAETDGAGWVQPGYHNLTYNADFEVWGGGASAAPTGWTLSGTGASAAREASTVRHGTYSVALTRTTADARLSQNIAAIVDFGPVAYWRGREVVFGCWVFSAAGNRARVGIADGVGESVSASHTGGSTWQFLQVTRTLDVAATKVEVFIEVHTGAATAYFDAGILSEGTWVAGFVPSSWRGRKTTLVFGSRNALAQNTAYGVGPWGETFNNLEVEFRVPYRGVARNLYASLSAAPAEGQTVTFTLQKNNTSQALTCQVTSAGRTAQDTTNEVAYGAGDAIDMLVQLSTTSGSRFCQSAIEYEEVPEGI